MPAAAMELPARLEEDETTAMGREWEGKILSGSPGAIFRNQTQHDKNMTETEGNRTQVDVVTRKGKCPSLTRSAYMCCIIFLNTMVTYIMS
jgi:hypothetical protein